MASRPRSSPTVPSAITRLPTFMPAMLRRPRNRRAMPPVSSTSVHSRLAIPPWGWTRMLWIRPATRARCRYRTSDTGMQPAGRSSTDATATDAFVEPFLDLAPRIRLNRPFGSGRDGATVAFAPRWHGSRGGRVELIDEHDDNVTPQDRCLRRARGVLLELLQLVLVLPVETDEPEHHEGHEDDDEPGAVGELGDGDDDVDDERQECADPV